MHIFLNLYTQNLGLLLLCVHLDYMTVIKSSLAFSLLDLILKFRTISPPELYLHEFWNYFQVNCKASFIQF
jgi:hypothetical protein